jgi:hypothetical protein
MYSVEQLQDIAFRGGIEAYVLPESILSLLKTVESQLEIVEYPEPTTTNTVAHGRPNIKPPHRLNGQGHEFATKTNGYRNKYDIPSYSSNDARNDHRRHDQNPRQSNHGKPSDNKRRELTEEDWGVMRNFKTTKIETKVGIEKQVNDLRVMLNKISKITYEKQRDAILATFRDYFASSEEEVTPENTARLSKAVFDIASTNKFYSELYADLFKELVQEFVVFRELLTEFVESYCVNSMKNIVYIDPDVDYDGYCVYVKQSDIRKSTTAFIVCCSARDLVDLGVVIDIVVEFIDTILRFKDMPGKTKELEEITELIFIMVSALNERAKNETKWEEDVMQEIERLSKMKTKDHVSLSNRAVFKFMDLMD